MKIKHIETVRVSDPADVIWVRIHTDTGLIGLGETWYASKTVESAVHDHFAPLIVGRDPFAIERHWLNMFRLSDHAGYGGAELRAISAIDMALWDLYAKRVNQPLYQVLGGLSRDRIRVYNTCAGYSYGVKKKGGWKAGQIDYQPEQPYEDFQEFMTDAGELADDLLSQGFTAMKIWPFDGYSNDTNGQFISATELDEGTEPFRKIREKVGNRMDVMVEMHAIWNLSSAKRIAKSVEPTDPFWFEDPVPMDNIDTLAQFRQSTHIATTASEQVASRWAFREMFEKQAMTICMFDISWVGGLSEAKRIASMAHAYHMPVAPHDCVGPVTLMFSVHLSLNAPNALIQETVRAYNATWYKDIVTALPKIDNGYVYAPEGIGAGTELLDTFLKDPATTVKTSDL